MGLYGSNDPTNSVKALKENKILRIRLQSHQVHPTALTIIQQLCSMKQKHTKYTQININKSMHSEMGPVWHNEIHRTVRTAHLSVLMTVQLQYTIQHRTVQIIFPLTSNQTWQNYSSAWLTNYNQPLSCSITITVSIITLNARLALFVTNVTLSTTANNKNVRHQSM